MHLLRASGSGPAALVLAGPVFLKVKIKFHLYKKQVIKNCVNFELVSLVILSCNRLKRLIKRCKNTGHPRI